MLKYRRTRLSENRRYRHYRHRYICESNIEKGKNMIPDGNNYELYIADEDEECYIPTGKIYSISPKVTEEDVIQMLLKDGWAERSDTLDIDFYNKDFQIFIDEEGMPFIQLSRRERIPF